MANVIEKLSFKVSLLYLIDKFPEQPSSNSHDQHTLLASTLPGRAISLKHELLIAQQLAFLCAYSDDPLHVLAVCIEEDASSDRLVTQVAANTGRHDRLLDGLSSVCKILQNEAKDVNRSTNQKALLEAVINLNRLRILSRLRSRHAPTHRARNKTPLLRRVITAQRVVRESFTDNALKQSLLNDFALLQTHIEVIERMDTTDARSSLSDPYLVELVTKIHHLLVDHLQQLMAIPYTPPLWDPHATQAFIDRLEKLSHYIVACKELLRVARRYQAFSHMDVAFVDLQQSGNRLSATASSNIEAGISNSCGETVLKRIAAKKQISVLQLRQYIKDRMVESSRLHAEIQLALYYEQAQNARQRPRVICSSKSACYLCHLFLRLQGQYFVPSSHGSLYDTWKWPSRSTSLVNNDHDIEPAMPDILPRVIAEVDKKILHWLNRRQSVRQRLDTRESRVDLIPTMTPSILSLVSHHLHSTSSTGTSTPQSAGVTRSPNDYIDRESVADTQVTRRSASSSRYSRRSEGAPALRQPNSRNALSPPQNSATSSRPEARPEACTLPSVPEVDDNNSTPTIGEEDISELSKTIPKPLMLPEGDRITRIFDPKHRVLSVHVPRLHVELEYDPSPSTSASALHSVPVRPQSLELEIEHLSSLTRPRADPTGPVVDLSGDWEDKRIPEGILYSREGLVLSNGRSIVRFRVAPVEDSVRHFIV